MNNFNITKFINDHPKILLEPPLIVLYILKLCFSLKLFYNFWFLLVGVVCANVNLWIFFSGLKLKIVIIILPFQWVCFVGRCFVGSYVYLNFLWGFHINGTQERFREGHVNFFSDDPSEIIVSIAWVGWYIYIYIFLFFSLIFMVY